jgi:hypothetical protein
VKEIFTDYQIELIRDGEQKTIAVTAPDGENWSLRTYDREYYDIEFSVGMVYHLRAWREAMKAVEESMKMLTHSVQQIQVSDFATALIDDIKKKPKPSKPPRWSTGRSIQLQATHISDAVKKLFWGLP